MYDFGPRSFSTTCLLTPAARYEKGAVVHKFSLVNESVFCTGQLHTENYEVYVRPRLLKQEPTHEIHEKGKIGVSQQI